MMSEFLIDFLTSNERGLHQLTPEQALAEIKSLDLVQREALILYYDAGLRGEDLRGMRFKYDYNFSERSFNSDDLNTIKFLVSDERGDNKLSPTEAATEINALTTRQQYVLCQLFDVGLRSPVLRAVNCYEIFKFQIEALCFLIHEARGRQQLTLEQAFAEIKSLEIDQINGLVKYYDRGLRGEHLRDVTFPSDYADSNHSFNEHDLNTIDFLVSNERREKKLSLRDALVEINGLSFHQQMMLRQLYDAGLRGPVLRVANWHAFGDFIINALRFFTHKARGSQQLTFEKAFTEIKSLNEQKIEALREYYDAGLRGEHLRALHFYDAYSRRQERPFCHSDRRTITFLVADARGDKKLSPEDAVAEINQLSDNQQRVLCQLYDAGLRSSVLRAANWGHSMHEYQMNVISVLLFLTNTARGSQQLTFEQAFPEIKSLNNTMIEALILYYDAGLRGEDLRGMRFMYDYDGSERSFNSNDLNTIKFLVSDERGDKKLSLTEAATEIKALTTGQQYVLCQLYDAGLRGSVLRIANCGHSMHEYEMNVISVLLFLTNTARGSQQLTFEQAFTEIKGLDKTQVEGLLKYYDVGLRREHLQQFKLPVELIGQILLCNRDLAELQALVIDVPTTSAENIYSIMMLAQNMTFSNDVLFMCSQEKQRQLFIIALTDSSTLGDFIFHHLLEKYQEDLFVRDKTHSLNSFLKHTIDSTEKNDFLIYRLKQLEGRQQAIIETNAKQAMFGWTMPNIGVVAPDESDTDELYPLVFDSLTEKIQALLPDNLKQEIELLRSNLYREDNSSPSTPITQDETILKLFQTLVKALVYYHQSTPNLANRRYLRWKEELREVGIKCKEGKIGALNNLMVSLATPLTAYIHSLLTTQTASILQYRLAVHPGMQAHYPQAAVCALLGIHQSLAHVDPFAFTLTKHTLETMASHVASAFDRASFIAAATPDVPDYFNQHSGMMVNVNSVDYRQHLSDFVYTLKRYGVYEQLGFRSGKCDVTIGSCLLGQIDDVAHFQSQLEEDDSQVLYIQIREDLRAQLTAQAEHLLVSKGILIPKADWNALKFRIKENLMHISGQSVDDTLWTEILTKRNGVQMVMDVLSEMTQQELSTLTIDIFLYKPHGIKAHLLEVMASNPLFAENIFSVKLIAEKTGPANDPNLNVYCDAYTESESQTRDAINTRQLFEQLNRKSAEQMQYFFEEFYTKPGSLHFSIVQLSNNGKDRQAITTCFLLYLAHNSELFSTTDSLILVIAHFLNHKDRVKNPTEYALVHTFLEERLEHLLQYNLLESYFKVVSLMPAHIISDAPHNKPYFFTSDRITTIEQQMSSLQSYFHQLGNEFNQAFQVARNSRLSQAALIDGGIFALPRSAENPTSPPSLSFS